MLAPRGAVLKSCSCREDGAFYAQLRAEMASHVDSRGLPGRVRPETECLAQGGGASAALSGIVADSSGAMIPGATITVKNEATAATYATVANDNGTFSVPALNPGTYTVTVSLTGFKTAVLTGVVIRAGVPAAVKPILEVGGLEEWSPSKAPARSCKRKHRP